MHQQSAELGNGCGCGRLCTQPAESFRLSSSIIPAIESASAATVGFIAICLTEAAASAVALLGAWRMWRQRVADHVSFASAKQAAILGAGIAVLTWFLGFQVIGGAGIMMGQAEGMEGAMRGAFTFGSYSFLTLIYLGLPDAGRRRIESAYDPLRTLEAQVRFRPISDIRDAKSNVLSPR